MKTKISHPGNYIKLFCTIFLFQIIFNALCLEFFQMHSFFFFYLDECLIGTREKLIKMEQRNFCKRERIIKENNYELKEMKIGVQ
jgi:hypothetical protein